MQRLLSRVRRCVDDFNMIQPGDRIAVGLSTGKDSLSLLWSLAQLRHFYPNPFELKAITLDLEGGRTDFSAVQEFCRSIDVEYVVVPTHIKTIVFDLRNEPNPCSLCAKLRRGGVNNTALSLGCNKIALGHHFDDAVETFMMSLIFEGRISCFQPVTYLDRKGVTVIRPLLYVGEKMLQNAAQELNLPVMQSTCPANGLTKRQEIKQLLEELSERYPDIKSKVFGAIRRLPLNGWGTGDEC
ncbi:MAG: tRNA 2-thiocytidine(32) synthetase TtcA [Clostridiales bacterium]|nr:tRNA 2-thiocytidine(32) synthetase TtcA [Clostridiales bacterium]